MTLWYVLKNLIWLVIQFIRKQIQNLFETELCTIYRLERQATNTYRENNPTIITFPVSVSCLIFGAYGGSISPTLLTETISDFQFQTVSFLSGDSNSGFKIKKTTDNKTFTIVRNSAEAQYNSTQNGSIFYGLVGTVYGSVVSTFFISDSCVWTVPYSRKYYIEVYGRGGGGMQNDYSYGNFAAGGSSCQSYSNISLNQGEKITVTIGNGRTGGSRPTRGGETSYATKGQSSSFGSYKAEGGGGATLSQGGQGAGNLGTDGNYSSNDSQYNETYSNGSLAAKKFGIGGSHGRDGGKGGVALKYLGA